jgi:probable HAF family extracellular repeat protein
MKTRGITLIITVVVLAALALPVRLAAQKQKEHHHYKVIDIATLGGPESHFNPGSGNDFTPFASVLNNAGTVAGFADTATSDPFQPFCFWNCAVDHAFRANDDGLLTDLGTLRGQGNSSAALGISANGLIAGLSENGEIDPLYAGLPEVRAILWQHGTMIDLGTLPEGGYESEASSVNSAGQVVGAALSTTPNTNSMQPAVFWLWGGIVPPYLYQTRAFLWDKQKGMQDLGTLAGGTDAEALLVNEEGQVVGNSYTSTAPSALCAGAGFALTTGSFMWDEKNGMRDLGNLGGTCTLVSDLNNRGQVIGGSSPAGDQFLHAFLWEHGLLQDLGGSLGGNNTGAFVLNDDGQAVGFATYPGEIIFHATLWRRVGEMTDLGTLGNDQCSYATGINARGQVVGASIPVCNSEGFRAFLWEDGSMVDLNALIPSNSPLYLTQIYTINDRGEIAGEGDDADGNGHAFLLIPCDENHPDIAGCDYNPVEAATVAQVRSAQITQAPTAASEAKLSPAEMMTRFRSLMARHYHPFGTPQTSPQ